MIHRIGTKMGFHHCDDRSSQIFSCLLLLLGLLVPLLPADTVRAYIPPPPQIQAESAVLQDEILVAPRSWGDQQPAVELGAGYYLVVWETTRSQLQTHRDIYGLRVRTDGVLFANPIPICRHANSQYDPDLAYNHSSGRFLVVWRDHRNGVTDIYGQLVDNLGNLIGGNFAISTAADSQFAPRVAYNSDDNEYLVVWQDHRSGFDGEIYGQRVASDGSLVGSNFAIATGGGTKIQPAVDYSITLGRYMVVWADYNGTDFDIYGQRLYESGALDGSSQAITTASGRQSNPEVALNAFNYEWLVIWRDEQNLTTTGRDIRGRRLQSNGTPTGTELIIAAGTEDEQRPYLIYNTHALEFLVTWSDQTVSPFGAIQARRIANDGTFPGSPFTIASGGHTRTDPALAYDTISKTYLAVWEDYRDGSGGETFGQRFDDAGNLVSTDRGISKWTDQSTSAAAYNPDDDEYLLVWRDQRGPDYDVWGRLLDGAGNPLGGDFLIGGGDGNQWYPDVAYNSHAGRYLVVWSGYDATTSDDIVGQLLEADGTFVGNNFQIVAASNSQSSPAVASSDSDRGFLVAWTDFRHGYSNSDVYARRVNNNGTLAGSELYLVTDAANQADPAIAYDSSTGTDNDRYVVVWRDERNGTDNRDLYARPIRRTGILETEFAVSTAANHQEYPSITYNSDDDQFLVVWKYRASGTYDIYGQLISSGGVLYGSEIPICTMTDAQYQPSVAYSTVGKRYLTVWEDSRAGASDVYGRMVRANGSRPDGDFAIVTADYSQYYVDVAYGSVRDHFLVSWADGRVWWHDEDVYVRPVLGGYYVFLPLTLKP
ncbi:MAG: hypothetical protein ACP5GX_01060 [Anaerolineae bacterium]